MLLGAHLAAALLVTVLFLSMTLIAPEPYLGYFSGYGSFGMTLVVNMAFSSPFAVSAFLLLNTWQRGRIRGGAWALLLAWSLFLFQALVTSWLLYWIWRDQFAASRGFALVGAIQYYVLAILPAWLLSVPVIGRSEAGRGAS